MLPYQVQGFGDPGVSHRGGIVVLADELPPLCWLGGYDFTIVLPPFSLSLDKVVGVNPRFEGTFVLRW